MLPKVRIDAGTVGVQHAFGKVTTAALLPGVRFVPPWSEVERYSTREEQFPQAREQAESMGLGARWHEIARTYAEVNMAFGDIVKVTPSSKVVGDMALFLVNHNMTVAEFERLTPDHNLTLPTSVIEMFQGTLGEPDVGWPKKLRAIILRGAKPMRGRPGARVARSGQASRWDG